MAPLPRKTVFIGAGAALLLLFPLIAEIAGEPYLISLFSRILIYALAAVSLDLILGYGGMVSLGHAAFFGIGAYVTGILAFHSVEGTAILSWPFPISGSENGLIVWPLAVMLSGLAAGIIGALSLRTSGMHFIMITLAFAQMLYYFFVSLEAYGGDDGLSLFSRNTFTGMNLGNDTHFYYLCLVLLGLFLFFSHRLVHSRFGMVIQGARSNEARMEAIGFPTFRYRLTAFVIAGTMAGLAGVLLANHTDFVNPDMMHWTRSGDLIIMVLLGGMGSLVGPIVGALVFLLLEEFLSGVTEYWQLIFGPILILVVLFARGGLLGFLTRYPVYGFAGYCFLISILTLVFL